MSFSKKTIRDIDLTGKTILLRTDYNVSLDDNGQIISDFRIARSLPTIKYLLDKNCKIIICSHLGRPDGKPDSKYSLKPIAKNLSELLGIEINMASDCVGPEVEKLVSELQPRQVLMLENLRFHPQEEANDDNFAKHLSKLAEVFVQDGFGVVHRAHASTEAVTHHLPSISGLLLENEVDTLTEAMQNPKRPLCAIIGGAKISDKIDILNNFVDIADFVAVGGAMANTFLLAQGKKVGKSLVEPDKVNLAKEIIQKAEDKAKKSKFVFYLPQDAVVAEKISSDAKTRIVDWDAHVVATIQNYPNKTPRNSGEVAENEIITDVGPFSSAFIAGGIQMNSTVIWNGTMGITDVKAMHGPVGPFSHSSETLMESMLGQFGNKPFSIIGGGDTAGYVEQRNLADSFNHVSTGGGASLELMSGKKLPGVEALLDKDSH